MKKRTIISFSLAVVMTILPVRQAFASVFGAMLQNDPEVSVFGALLESESSDAEVVEGNPSCSDLGYQYEYKVDPPDAGTYYIDGIYELVVTRNGEYFDWSSELGMDAVIAKGGPDGNVYTYDPEAFEDQGLHSPIDTNRDEPYGLSHISFCYDYQLDVSKTAETAYVRTWDWDIEKSVNPDTINEFIGGSDSVDYSVEVTKTGYTDGGFKVYGDIVIANNTPFDAEITGVTDTLNYGDGSEGATVSCPFDPAPSYVLAAGQSVTCTYEAYPSTGTEGVNHAYVSTTGTVLGDTDTVNYAFGEPTEVVDGAVNVEDSNDTGGVLPAVTGGTTTFNYTRTFSCSSNPEDYENGFYSYPHENTATITTTGDSDSASITVNCYAPSLSKDAVTSYDREKEWNITKDVDVPTHELFLGESADSNYTVTVTPYTIDKNWNVSGTITVNNPNPYKDMYVDLTDVVSGGIGATLDCGSGLSVPAGQSATCGYTAQLPDGDQRVNTATLTINGVAFSTQADVLFGEPNYTGYESINVTDTNGESWGPVSSETTWNYTREFACSGNPEDYTDGTYSDSYPNVATITETGMNDDALVTKNCYAPQVEKNAAATYDRTYEWDITKSADKNSVDLELGESADVNYDVVVDVVGTTDSDWGVTGEITVYNNHPSSPMTVDLTDVISGGYAATLDCGGTLNVPAGGSATCGYTAGLPDDSTRTNTATVYFNGAEFTGTADVIFTGPTNTVDECIDVDDDKYGELGTVCEDNAPQTFSYTSTVGPFEVCGDYQYVNIASFVTNDRDLEDSDSWTVDASVECAYLCCTLTPGYWKTHSVYGPAERDEGWNELSDGEDTEFFLSEQTYYEVLTTEPNDDSDAYYILARAYIAAELNTLNGAYMPPEVRDEFEKAKAWFELYTPADVAEFKGKDKKKREEFLDVYEILDDYNNGLLGVPHCS